MSAVPRMEQMWTQADDDASRQKVIDYGRTFGTESGQRVLEDLRRKFYGVRSTFASDPLELARNTGQREALLYIERYVQEMIAPKDARPTEAEIG